MGFFDRFKRKRRGEDSPAQTGKIVTAGQPVNAVITPPGEALPHPGHYDRERNGARIAQLESAIEMWDETDGPKQFPEKYAELKAELQRQLKIRELFYSSGQEV